MHLHRVALIVVIAAIACEVSWADTQHEMMDTYMQDYNRAKRSMENMEEPKIPQIDEETKQITKRNNEFDYSTLMDPTMMDTTMMDSMMTESHGQPQKRQLFGRRYNPYSYGYPYNRYQYRGYPQAYGYGYPAVNYSPLNSLAYGRFNRYPYYY